MDPVDMSIVAFLVQEITGIKSGTDSTCFLWQNGSIYRTIPAIPNLLRGTDLFKNIKHLRPSTKFTGAMEIHRQGGEVKGWTFIEKT